MRIYLIIVIILFGNIKLLYSQVNFVIEELKVSNITPNLNDSIFEEDETDGPFVSLTCLLTNESGKNIFLYPSKSNIRILFNYEGVDYHIDVIAIPFADQEMLTIERNGTVELTMGTNLLLGTKLWSENRSDYRMILLGLLPTIRVEYKDPNIKCHSTKISRVVIL